MALLFRLSCKMLQRRSILVGYCICWGLRTPFLTRELLHNEENPLHPPRNELVLGDQFYPLRLIGILGGRHPRLNFIVAVYSTEPKFDLQGQYLLRYLLPHHQFMISWLPKILKLGS